MITLLETKVTVSMSLYEARALRKALGACSTSQLHEAGLTLGEIQAYDEIYRAFGEYLTGPKASTSSED